MAKLFGRAGTVSVGDAVAEVTGFSYSSEADPVEATACTDTEKTYEMGIESGSGTVDCYWAPSDTGHIALLAALTAGTSVTLTLVPAGAAGLYDLEGDVKISGAAMTHAHDGFITISFSFVGVLTTATIAA